MKDALLDQLFSWIHREVDIRLVSEALLLPS